MVKKILVLFFLLSFPLIVFASSVNVENIKINFLKGEYKICIKEGENLLAGARRDTKNLDELYYYLGLSYLKDGNLLRAADIFDIILKEFKFSKFTEVAMISMGDVYRQKGQLDFAEKNYQDVLKKFPSTKLRKDIEIRLTKVQTQEEQKIVTKPVSVAPVVSVAPILEEKKQTKLESNFENQDLPIVLADDLKGTPGIEAFISATASKVSATSSNNSNSSIVSSGVYSVQVGAFSKKVNAESLVDKLNGKGYIAFVVNSGSADKITYKVRVGKLNSINEAKNLEKDLSGQGYPTKIVP